MTRVMLIGKNTILADAIEASLLHAPEVDLFRLPPCQVSNIEQMIRKSKTEVIICEEEMLSHELKNISDIFWTAGCLLLIVISTYKQRLHVWQRYEITNPGMNIIVNMVKDFKQNLIGTTNWA